METRSIYEMPVPDNIRSGESDLDHYLKEVLQLQDGRSEETLDDALEQEAQQLGLAIAKRPLTKARKRTSTCDSYRTAATDDAGTESTKSRQTNWTMATSICPSNENVVLRALTPAAKRESQSFLNYESFLLRSRTQDALRTGFGNSPTPEPSLFSMSSRRSYASVKQSLKNRLSLTRRKTMSNMRSGGSCVNCRNELRTTKDLQTLSCKHSYCHHCLHVLVNQAVTDEANMPPRCCALPLPTRVLKLVLTPDEQITFMDAVTQYSTPWAERIFCSSSSCGTFIPQSTLPCPTRPLDLTCPGCSQSTCSICRKSAHELGQDCPADWELSTVVQIGDGGGWKRCYQCRNLVKSTDDCAYMTCKCDAQICYVCGAIWDAVSGCPNSCNGDAEMERRRREEQDRVFLEAQETLARIEKQQQETQDKADAERRTKESRELQALRARQLATRERFAAFERNRRHAMWARHSKLKVAILDRYADLETSMRARHTSIATQLEDRQVAAELELRATHKQSERSMRIRLKHMETYCASLGQATFVTERDLRELGNQYNVRDDMARLHTSRVNVMREKQARQMEALLARQELELEALGTKQSEELHACIEKCATEETASDAADVSRKARLTWRWVVQELVARHKLEMAGGGGKFAPMSPLRWPDEEEKEVVLMS